MLRAGAIQLHRPGLAFQPRRAAVVLLLIFFNGHAQLLQRQRAAVAQKRAALHHDFQPVVARHVAGGGDKHARRAVFEFHIGRHVVLNLDVVPLSVVREGAHAHGHAYHPLQKVKVVRALVQQNAAALAVPRGAPRAGIVVVLRAEPVRNQPVHAPQRTQLARGDDLLHLAIHAMRALVEHDGECLIALSRQLVFFPYGLGVYARGLLAHHVQPVVQRRYCQRRMQIVRRGDQHGVNQSAGHQRFRVVKYRDVRIRLPNPCAPLLADIRDGRQHKMLDLSGHNPFHVTAAHVSNADNADSYVFHASVPPQKIKPFGSPAKTTGLPDG